MNISLIIAGASNIKGGDNPPFTVEDFKTLYPHFFVVTENETEPLAPMAVIEACIRLADSSVKKSRYHEAWEICMGLFVAHFITLYLQTLSEPNGGANAAAQAGLTKGIISSASVDGVSVSYDLNQSLADLDGWAAWKLTNYGVQLATFAKLFSMGGMYIP